jgi:hypothetical protein
VNSESVNTYYSIVNSQLKGMTIMKNRLLTQTLTAIFSVTLLLFCNAGFAENIDPYDDDSQYAYGENVGWFNAEPGGDGGEGIEVEDSKLTGYTWAENIGWVILSCENTSSCGTVDYGVTNDGNGNLSGYGWCENVGWINFAPTGGGVTIDANGDFNGWAWGENIGWVHLQNPSIPYKVQTLWAPSQAPTVTTQAVTGTGTTTATGNGTITDLGAPNPTAHGICWNTTGNPTTSDDKTDKGAASSTGAFTSDMAGLSPNTKYYVRAYATNTVGTAYGADVFFTTKFLPPDVTGITPDHGNRGQTLDNVSITGSDFRDVAITTQLKNGGDTISGTDVTWVSDTEVTSDFTIPGGATIGPWDVYLEHDDDGKSDTLVGGFTVEHPAPTTTGLSPSSRTAGEAGFTLTVDGANFVAGSTVRWEGADRATTYVSATQLTATIPASDITTAGTFDVTVFNPAPGGGTSNTQVLTVIAGTATKIRVETAADGSGSVVSAQSVIQGNSITVYAISRDAQNNFVANVTDGAWSLVDKSGGVVDGDLAGGSGSALFTAHKTGTAKIRVTKTGLASTDSGTITVSAGAASQVILTGPSTVTAGAVSTAFTLTSRDGDGNAANVTADTKFDLSSNSIGTATFYSNAGGTAAITQVTLSNGTSTATFYYKDTNAGTPTVTATRTSGMSLGSDTHQVTVSLAATTLATSTSVALSFKDFKVTVTKIEMNNGTSWVTIFSGTAELDLVNGGTFPGISDVSLPSGTYNQIRVTFRNSLPVTGTLNYNGIDYYTTTATFGGESNVASNPTTNSGSEAIFTFRIEDWGAVNADVIQTYPITPVTVGPSTDYQPTLRFTISNKLLFKGTAGTASTYYFSLGVPTVSIVEP